MSDLWYYAEGSETVGPVDFDGLGQVLKRKARPQDVLVWQEGYADWVEAGTLPALKAVFVRPPPVPVRSVPKPPVLEQRNSPLPPEYRQAAAQVEKKPRNWMGTISGWAVIVVSVVVGRAFGGLYWLPALLIALCIWIFTKLKLRDYAAWMLGVLVGHTLWMAVGHGTLFAMGKPNEELATFAVDAVVVTCLTIWGMKTQSVAVSVCVLVYQIVAFATNAVFFEEYSKVNATAPILHLILRAIGMGVAIYAIVKARQFKRQVEVQPAVA
jgi:hypothetical protein